MLRRLVAGRRPRGEGDVRDMTDFGTATPIPAKRPAVDVPAVAVQALLAPHTLSLVAPATTEAGFQKSVVDLAHLCRWRVAYFRAGRVRRGSIEKYETAVGGDGRGWPDLVLVRDRVIFAELKSDRGKLRPDQMKWKDWLIAAGQEYHLFRPSSWPEIVRTLA